MIRVRANGKTEIEVGPMVIRPGADVLFSVLLYLTCNAGESVPRRRLLELFWPAAPDASARHSLRQLLYRLRRAGAGLVDAGDEVTAPVALVESDIVRMLATSWPATAGIDDIASAASLVAGLSTAAGGELLREWIDALRARVAAQHRRAVLHQLGLARAEGRWSEVELWAERTLAADPLNEEATLARAESIAMTGSKVRAIGVLEEFATELGAHEPALGLPTRVLRRRISERGLLTVKRGPVMPPFVGRARETALLNEIILSAGSGGAAAAVIAGAPGIGKSALARRLCESVHLLGWPTVEARLRASDADRPLGALVDLFSRLLQMGNCCSKRTKRWLVARETYSRGKKKPTKPATIDIIKSPRKRTKKPTAKNATGDRNCNT